MELSTGSEDLNPLLSALALAGLAGGLVLVAIGGFPLDAPMPTHALGWVTPTCGLTRGSTALLRGDWGLAWRYNPASYAVIAFGVAGVVRWIVGRRTGRWLNLRFRAGTWTAALAVLLVGLLWWVQQSNADFVIHSRA